MKFRRILEYHTVPEWSLYYVDYRLLKKLLQIYQNSLQSAHSDISESLLGNYDAFKEYKLELELQFDRVKDFYTEKLRTLRGEFKSIVGHIYNLKRVSTLNAEEANGLLSMKERDDAQNRAISMQRAFTELHTHIIWLEGFCEINYVALLRILARFNPDIEKFNIDSENYRVWEKDLKELKEKIYEITAAECMNGDLDSAIQLMNEIKRFKGIDIGVISFCIGVLFVMGNVAGFMLARNDLDLLGPSIFVFRFTFCVPFTVVLLSFMVFVLEKYQINWMYILEIAPTHKVSYVEILRFGVLMLTCWQTLFTLHLSTVFYYPFIANNIVSIWTFAGFALLFSCPFNLFSRESRFSFYTLIFQLIIAPFGGIRFKNYLTGSWLTSMVILLQDIYCTISLLCSANFLTNASVKTSQPIMFFISILPFIWRILQNVKRVIHKKSLFWRQVQNFSRYIISIALAATAYFDYYLNLIWIFSFIAGVIVISLLDVKQDWNLTFADYGKSRSFPVKLYVFAGISNFLLRFAGVGCLLPVKVFVNPHISAEVCVTFLMIFEVIRRTQWTVIRIEREQCNNEEKYRKVAHVPRFSIRKRKIMD